MSENKSQSEKSEAKPSEARFVFIAVSVIALVWFCLFIVLPALTGKPGVAQKMQGDLLEESVDVPPQN